MCRSRIHFCRGTWPQTQPGNWRTSQYGHMDELLVDCMHECSEIDRLQVLLRRLVLRCRVMRREVSQLVEGVVAADVMEVMEGEAGGMPEGVIDVAGGNMFASTRARSGRVALGS